jgi:hypothetical protein
MKSERDEQQADVTIEDNILTSLRNNSLGVSVVRASGASIATDKLQSANIVNKNTMHINGQAFLLQ